MKRKLRKLIKRLIGRWRIFWNVCPECNSDAPKLDTCKVCDSYRGQFQGYPPTRLRKARWWRRYIMARCTHGVPMECRCKECDKWWIRTPRISYGTWPSNPRRG